MRAIKKIHGDKPSHWIGDGFHVRTLISHFSEEPDFNYRHTDPFLLFDYGLPKHFEPNPHFDTHPYGIGQHPHKGFETVTIAYAGELSHADSAGGLGTILPGDVKWMTAGRGITHEEFHSKNFGQHGGVFSMVQMWINLPQADKLTAPNHQTLRRSKIPVIKLTHKSDNDNDKIVAQMRLIAGDYQGITGAADTFTAINLWDIEVLATGMTTLDIPNNHNVMLLVQEGELLVNGAIVEAGKLIQFTAPVKSATVNDTDIIELSYPAVSDNDLALAPIKVLLFSGEPISEPIASYGPFVMTSQDELDQTFQEYQTGKFG